MRVMQDFNVTEKVIAFYWSEREKNELLEQFHVELVDFASRADCEEHRDEWVRDMFTANMHNDKIEEELLEELPYHHRTHMNTPSDVVQILNIAKTMKRIHSDHHHQMTRNNRLQSTSRPE